MSKYIHNLSIHYKLMSLFSPAIIGLLIFSITTVVEKSKISNEMSILKKETGAAVLASALIHEMQKERGLSAGYLGSKGKNFSKDLFTQKRVTDNRFRVIQIYLKGVSFVAKDQSFKRDLQKAIQNYKKLISAREKLTNATISMKNLIDSYTHTIRLFLDAIVHISQIESKHSLAMLTRTYANLLKSKEKKSETITSAAELTEDSEGFHIALNASQMPPAERDKARRTLRKAYRLLANPKKIND